jgi:hypothetical protein
MALSLMSKLLKDYRPTEKNVDQWLLDAVVPRPSQPLTTRSFCAGATLTNDLQVGSLTNNKPVLVAGLREKI